MPIGQVNGTHLRASSVSISSSRSIGSLPSRSSLLIKVIIGVSRNRHTSINFNVRSSIPLATSITINAESTAVKVRYVSSEKSACPGVSNRLINLLLYSNCITELVTEIPLSFSIFIQSDVACREDFLALTVPAICMAPPNKSNCSVTVVFPASG